MVKTPKSTASTSKSKSKSSRGPPKLNISAWDETMAGNNPNCEQLKTLMLQAQKRDPNGENNIEFLWRLAQVTILMYRDVPPEAELNKYIAEAIDYGKRAIALVPNHPQANLWLALAAVFKAVNDIKQNSATHEAFALFVRAIAVASRELPKHHLVLFLKATQDKILAASQAELKQKLAAALAPDPLPEPNLDQAVSALRLCVLLKPDCIEAYFALAMTFVMQQRPRSEIMSVLNRGLAQRPLFASDREVAGQMHNMKLNLDAVLRAQVEASKANQH